MPNSTYSKTKRNLIQQWQQCADQRRYYNDGVANRKNISLETLFEQPSREETNNDEVNETEGFLEELRQALEED